MSWIMLTATSASLRFGDGDSDTISADNQSQVNLDNKEFSSYLYMHKNHELSACKSGLCMNRPAPRLRFVG